MHEAALAAWRRPPEQQGSPSPEGRTMSSPKIQGNQKEHSIAGAVATVLRHVQPSRVRGFSPDSHNVACARTTGNDFPI